MRPPCGLRHPTNGRTQFGSATRRSRCDPRSILLSGEDSARATRQPVTTISFSGSPGRNSLRLRSPSRAEERVPRRPQHPCRWARLRRDEEGGHQHAPRRGAGAQGLAQRGGRAQAEVGEQAFADEEGGRGGIVAGGRQQGPQVVGHEVRPDVGDPGRLRAERLQPPPLVVLRRGEVHLEPAHRIPGETQRTPVVAGAEEDDLRRPGAERTRHLGVDDPRSLGHPGRTAERQREHAGHVRVEPPLRLDVARRRRGPRAGEPGPVGRDPARGDGGPRRRHQSDRQGVIALAPAGARFPRRSDR